MHRSPFCWLILVLALGVTPLHGAPPNGTGVTRGPVVQMTSNTSAVLLWRTVGATTPLVRYGASVDALNQVSVAGQTITRVSESPGAPDGIPRLSDASPDTYQYEVTLTGLTEDTIYFYGVYDDATLLAGCSADHYFRTQPPATTARPLRFWVVGDSGDGGKAQLSSFNAMKDFVANDGRAVDAYIHLGDMAYNDGTDAVFQTNFFDVYSGLLRNTVTWATMGNHEGHNSDGILGIGPYYDAFVHPTNGEAGGVPSGSEAYYSFNSGPIHFVCLNSHDEVRTQAGAMATWLQQDLAANNSDWLIAFWHHPPYSKGSHHSDAEDQLVEMREIMVPILETHGVDLILSGHSHLYERSMLFTGAHTTPTTSTDVILDDGDGDPAGDGAYQKNEHQHPNDGTVAVVAGHGRGAFGRFGLSPVHRKSILETGSVLMDLDGDTLTVRMLNDLGVVRDEFQIIKRGILPPRAPLSDPWHPAGPAIVVAERVSGEAETHLFARPDAADAVVHYTLDGTVPTTASPVYNGPLRLSTLTTVSALSVWRGGQRTSPVATKIITPPIPGSNFLRIPILHSEDDATEDNLGMIDLTGPVLGTDSTSGKTVQGLRFRNVPIPAGATILASGILFAPGTVNFEPATWTIGADLSAASNPFTFAAQDLSSRPLSNNTTAWNIPAWHWVEFQSNSQITPGLTGMLEEIINQPTWNSGDAMGFLFSGSGSREPISFDENPEWAPELRVIYDERDPFTVASEISPVVEVEVEPDGTRHLFATYMPIQTATVRGYVYTVEGSTTMEPGTWETLNSSFNRQLFSNKVGFFNLRFELSLPDGGPWGEEYFIRVRLTAQ